MTGRDSEGTDTRSNTLWHTGERSSMLPEPSLFFPSKSSAGEPGSSSGPWYAALAGCVSIACALLVLLGWAFDIDTLKSILPHAAHMKPFTAVSLLCLGIAVVLSVVRRPAYVASPERVWLARAMALDRAVDRRRDADRVPDRRSRWASISCYSAKRCWLTAERCRDAFRSPPRQH